MRYHTLLSQKVKRRFVMMDVICTVLIRPSDVGHGNKNGCTGRTFSGGVGLPLFGGSQAVQWVEGSRGREEESPAFVFVCQFSPDENECQTKHL